eukprot:TRINITY_DN69029_c0_g1_i1.p1 TRINITY_DN69029_c0_g1~~TRINITY_DN69029_c0_g1_i1.p1  ORF type:complete len:458 (+),score=40.98 TRINITY_DN69029_c0_g1_i1:64-1437(+)
MTYEEDVLYLVEKKYPLIVEKLLSNLVADRATNVIQHMLTTLEKDNSRINAQFTQLLSSYSNSRKASSNPLLLRVAATANKLVQSSVDKGNMTSSPIEVDNLRLQSVVIGSSQYKQLQAELATLSKIADLAVQIQNNTLYTQVQVLTDYLGRCVLTSPIVTPFTNCTEVYGPSTPFRDSSAEALFTGLLSACNMKLTTGAPSGGVRLLVKKEKETKSYYIDNAAQVVKFPTGVTDPCCPSHPAPHFRLEFIKNYPHGPISIPLSANTAKQLLEYRDSSCVEAVVSTLLIAAKDAYSLSYQKFLHPHKKALATLLHSSGLNVRCLAVVWRGLKSRQDSGAAQQIVAADMVARCVRDVANSECGKHTPNPDASTVVGAQIQKLKNTNSQQWITETTATCGNTLQKKFAVTNSEIPEIVTAACSAPFGLTHELAAAMLGQTKDGVTPTPKTLSPTWLPHP